MKEMARKPRVIAKSGVYHVIMRGVNKQRIFGDDEDRMFMVRALWRLQWWDEKVGQQEFNAPENTEQHRSFTLYAYCLMDNHVHLLMKSEEEDIGCCVRRIGDAYVRFYNDRWNRVGHLFQNRFKSEPVEDIEYFVTLLHYINYNPVKAKMVDNAVDYLWSSARELTDMSDRLPAICHRKTVWSRIGKDNMRDLLRCNCTAECMEDEQPDISDSEVWNIVERECGARCMEEFKQLEKHQQQMVAIKLMQRDVSKERIKRLLGMSQRQATYASKQKGGTMGSDPNVPDERANINSGTMGSDPNVPVDSELLT